MKKAYVSHQEVPRHKKDPHYCGSVTKITPYDGTLYLVYGINIYDFCDVVKNFLFSAVFY